MKRYTGRGVFGAVATGKIMIFKSNDISVKKATVTDTEKEKIRYESAKAQANTQLEEIYDR